LAYFLIVTGALLELPVSGFPEGAFSAGSAMAAAHQIGAEGVPPRHFFGSAPGKFMRCSISGLGAALARVSCWEAKLLLQRNYCSAHSLGPA
jgi:hypothetical protein